MGSPRLAPSVIDQRARTAGTTIGTLRDVIPKECFVIEPHKSWSALLVAVVRLVFSLFLLTLIHPVWGPSLAWQIPLLLAAWLFYRSQPR